MKKIIILLIFLTVLFPILAFAAQTIRFATEATYPPFEYMDDAGQIRGFDIDVAKALCQELNAQCTFAAQSFNSLIPSLKLGKYDALIAAIGITPERQQQVSFTQQYYEPSACFVAAKSKNYTMESIVGKTIGVQEGTTFVNYLNDHYHNKVTVKTYASIQDAFLDLVAGRVDAVIADTPIASAWLKQDGNEKNYGLIGDPVVDHDYFGSGFGIAVNKNNPQLLNSLNTALAKIKANGVYAKLVTVYFGAR